MSVFTKSYDDLIYKIEKNCLWITLDRPKQLNAITIPMVRSLTLLLNEADVSKEILIIIISGSGKAFCAGGDIKDMIDEKGMFEGDSEDLRRKYTREIQMIPKTIERIETPIIAMIDGAAVGAGMDLALMCDIRLATKRSKFGTAFSKINLVPGDGGTFFLPRIVGFAKAMEMFLTADIYSSQEALSIGLINYVYDDEVELLINTKKMISKIIKNGTTALRMTKKALKISVQNDLLTSLDLLAAYQGITQKSKDHFKRLAPFNK